MQHHLQRRLQIRILGDDFASICVPVEPWEVAAGNLQSDSVAGLGIAGGEPCAHQGHRDAPGYLHGASWGADGTIIFATSENNKGLFRVPAAGGEPEVVTTPDAEQGEQAHRWPEVLPGGQAVLFTIFTGDGPHIAVLDLETGDYRFLIPGGSNPHYSPTGHIIYGLDGALWAAGFDSASHELNSDPVPVREEVMTKLPVRRTLPFLGRDP